MHRCQVAKKLGAKNCNNVEIQNDLFVTTRLASLTNFCGINCNLANPPLPFDIGPSAVCCSIGLLLQYFTKPHVVG